MKIKYIQDEAFSDYQKPYMFIGTCMCSFKCCIEAGIPIKVCQNSNWTQEVLDHNVNNDLIVERYLSNHITEAIVFGGLEPLDQFDELIELIRLFRQKTQDSIIIYTGFYKYEILNYIDQLKQFTNIIIKYGRFIPNDTPRFDDVLGITLISHNQYAEKIS